MRVRASRERGEGGGGGGRAREKGERERDCSSNDQQLYLSLACCVHSETLFAHSVDISVGIHGSVWVHTSLCRSFHAHPSFLSLFTYSHCCIHTHNPINPITLIILASTYMYSLLYCQAIQFFVDLGALLL